VLFEHYLNNVPFGYSIEGIEAASRFWFARPAAELDEHMAFLLMAIPRNPSRYALQNSPERAVEAAIRSGRRIGREMYGDALFSAVRVASAATGSGSRTQRLLLDSSRPSLGLAHFTSRVMSLATESFVRTTLDLGIQALLVQATEEALHDAADHRIHDAAGIVIDNMNGEVLGYLGSSPNGTPYGRSYIDAIRVARSPASTIKPFLFALAFERGYTAETLFEDEAIRFGSDEVYIPFNFNNQFNGTVSAAVALGSSLNVPAVSLYEQLGQAAFMQYMDALGMSVFIQEMSEAGLGAVLGSARATLEELAVAYTTLARGGIPVPLSFTPTGSVRRDVSTGRRVISEAAARQVAEILASPEYRYLGFPADSFLHENHGVLLKTGTASQFSDILAVAANELHTVVVWMGNLDGQTVIGQPGSSLPARIALSTINGIAEIE
jgi:penicillin-binding protein 1C